MHSSPESFESKLHISCVFTPKILQCKFLKKNDVFLHDHSTVITLKKFSIDTIILSDVLSIFQLCQLTG